jgi:predicted TPR repeat methyltransferase
MRYIPSKDVKGKDVMYEGILDRTPWVIADGTLDHIIGLYKLQECEHIEDIGCGNGSTLQYFAETSEPLSGTDLNNYLTVPCKEKILT